MRPALVAAIVAGLVLVAVPLVLWPLHAKKSGQAVESASLVLPSAPAPDPQQALVAAAMDGGVETDSLKLGQIWIDRCERPGPGHTPRERCDRQPFFEEALVKAILENAGCAAGLKKGGTVSVALKVDYRRKRLRVFAGKSGSIGYFASSEFIGCIQRALPTPEWSSLPHVHTKYVIAVTATIGSGDST